MINPGSATCCSHCLTYAALNHSYREKLSSFRCTLHILLLDSSCSKLPAFHICQAHKINILPSDKGWHDSNTQEYISPHPFLLPTPEAQFHQVSSNSKKVSPLTATAGQLIGEASLSAPLNVLDYIGNLIPDVCSYPQKSRHLGENVRNSLATHTHSHHGMHHCSYAQSQQAVAKQTPV